MFYKSYEIIGFPFLPPKHTQPCEIIDTALITSGILPGFPHLGVGRLGPNCLEGRKPLSPPWLPLDGVRERPFQLFQESRGEGLNVSESIRTVLYELHFTNLTPK